MEKKGFSQGGEWGVGSGEMSNEQGAMSNGRMKNLTTEDTELHGGKRGGWPRFWIEWPLFITECSLFEIEGSQFSSECSLFFTECPLFEIEGSQYFTESSHFRSECSQFFYRIWGKMGEI